MNTRQHILNPVERTLCVSRLLGRPSQHQADRGYPDPCFVLDMGHAAGISLDFGSSAEPTGKAFTA